MTATTRTAPVTPMPVSQLTHIAAAVDSLPEGNDAAVLASAITGAVGGDLVLVAIEPELPLFIPGVDRREMRRATGQMLARTRDCVAPGARSVIEIDLSSAHGLKRALGRQHRQLVVCGSSRHGPEGGVSLGRTTRQLLGQVACAMAIAPRGLSSRGETFRLRRIAVGFDGGAESRLALSTAATIAAGAGAQLVVCGVVDDRIPKLTWPNLWIRRWGAAARLLFGGTGEGLAHRAQCAMLVVPRPDDES